MNCKSFCSSWSSLPVSLLPLCLCVCWCIVQTICASLTDASCSWKDFTVDFYFLSTICLALSERRDRRLLAFTSGFILLHSFFPNWEEWRRRRMLDGGGGGGWKSKEEARVNFSFFHSLLSGNVGENKSKYTDRWWTRFYFRWAIFPPRTFILNCHHASVCIFESCRTDARRKKNKWRTPLMVKLIQREKEWVAKARPASKNICLNVENALPLSLSLLLRFLRSFCFILFSTQNYTQLLMFPCACFLSFLFCIREKLYSATNLPLCQILPFSLPPRTLSPLPLPGLSELSWVFLLSLALFQPHSTHRNRVPAVCV